MSFLLFLSLLVFTFVFIVGNMVKLSHVLVNSQISPEVMGQMFLLFVPFVIGYTLPVATLCAVVLLFGRLSSDNEINALRSSGVSLLRIVMPIIALSALLSILTFIVNDKIEPEAHYRARKIVVEIGIKKPMAYLEPGTFIDIFPGYIIFVYRMQGNFLENVRIYQLKPDGPPRILVAEKGQVIVDESARKIKLRLENVISDEVDPTKPDRVYKFYSRQYFINFDIPQEGRKEVTRKLKEHSIKDLFQLAKVYSEKGIDVEPIWIEVHKRIAFALSPLVLTIFAIPLSIKTRRAEASVGLVLVALISLAYYLAMLLAEAVAVKGWVPPYVSLYMPDLLFLLLGIILFWTQR